MKCEMRVVRCGCVAPYPLDNCFWTMSSVASACNENTHKVSTLGSLIFVLLGDHSKTDQLQPSDM